MSEEDGEGIVEEAVAVEESESFNVIDDLKRSLIYGVLRRGLHEYVVAHITINCLLSRMM